MLKFGPRKKHGQTTGSALHAGVLGALAPSCSLPIIYPILSGLMIPVKLPRFSNVCFRAFARCATRTLPLGYRASLSRRGKLCCRLSDDLGGWAHRLPVAAYAERLGYCK